MISAFTETAPLQSRSIKHAVNISVLCVKAKHLPRRTAKYQTKQSTWSIYVNWSHCTTLGAARNCSHRYALKFQLCIGFIDNLLAYIYFYSQQCAENIEMKKKRKNTVLKIPNTCTYIHTQYDMRQFQMTRCDTCSDLTYIKKLTEEASL